MGTFKAVVIDKTEARAERRVSANSTTRISWRAT